MLQQQWSRQGQNAHLKEKKWLKFYDGQYQFKVPFMLYADFESILKPVDERYRDKMCY